MLKGDETMPLAKLLSLVDGLLLSLGDLTNFQNPMIMVMVMVMRGNAINKHLSLDLLNQKTK
jgi:hypothetical protein